MQPSTTRAALPFWLLIVIIGIIVGVSMGRAQSMGLYLKPVTAALNIGREPFGLSMALSQLSDGRRCAAFRGADRQVRCGPYRRRLPAHHDRGALG